MFGCSHRKMDDKYESPDSSQNTGTRVQCQESITRQAMQV